jgi:3-dehydroquinate dehydratase-2
MELVVINGPNLNLLGRRETGFYGSFTLADLERRLMEHVGNRARLSFFHSNSEGDIINYIQTLTENHRLIINAAALTHTSIGIRDALSAVKTPFIEVHISNVYAREDFRRHSYLSAIARGVIVGLGAEGYLLAADYFLNQQN